MRQAFYDKWENLNVPFLVGCSSSAVFWGLDFLPFEIGVRFHID